MKIILVLFMALISCIGYAETKLATFAGGCFWCMEPPFEKLVGVKSVISGYTGGIIKDPTYEKVSSGKTKHREAVQVKYDPSLISYERLVEVFWMNIDPTDAKGQFVDKGFQYTSAIYFNDLEEKKIAIESQRLLKELKKFSKVVTPILKFKNFHAAEDYHQDYYKKNLLTKTKYKYYRKASGRDTFLNKYWKKGDRFRWKQEYKKPSKKKIRQKLTKLQFSVTQDESTEAPFKNQYWSNKKEGVYVDIVSGEPLFSSKNKFKSGTGWPSFTRPIDPNYIIELKDTALFSDRVEVKSRYANSHLGHVFRDGPAPTGLRYCINSASLKFIPKKDLVKSGLAKYSKLFNGN